MSSEKPQTRGGPRGWIRNSPESARLRFHCWPKNQGKGAPLRNRRQLPSTGILSEVFLPICPWHHQQTEKQKNCQLEQDFDQVLYSAMYGRQCENEQHGDTMQEKARDMFLCTLQINIKKRARCGSVMQAACVLL